MPLEAENPPDHARDGEENLAERIQSLEEQLVLLQRAHDVRGERLIAERTAFGEHVQILNEEVVQFGEELEWRRRTMDEMEKEIVSHLATIQWLETRLNTPVRRLVRALRSGFRKRQS